MPDFVGIGGQRCGTTWLWANLRRHPQIRFPAGKEIHHWDRHSNDGAAPWLKMFPQTRSGVRQGEITPAYAILPQDVVREIARAAPDLRLLLNIRNPIQRSWSAALLFSRWCQMDPDEPSDSWFTDVLLSWRCRAKGTFSKTIRTWRDSFSTEQLLLVLYDDILERPSSVLQSVATHLGVDEHFYDSGSAEFATRHGKMTSGERAPSIELIELLRSLYEDEIRRLECILDRDLGHWLTWNGT